MKEKLTAVLDDHVLGRPGPPIVLVLDEVDRVFGRTYQYDFFGLLRSWHNARAMRAALAQRSRLLRAAVPTRSRSIAAGSPRRSDACPFGDWTREPAIREPDASP